MIYIAVEIHMQQNSDHYLSSLHYVVVLHSRMLLLIMVRAVVNPNPNILYCTGNAIQTFKN